MPALPGLNERKLIQLGLIMFFLCYFADDKVTDGWIIRFNDL